MDFFGFDGEVIWDETGGDRWPFAMAVGTFLNAY
jgi:hypothetical protein